MDDDKKAASSDNEETQSRRRAKNLKLHQLGDYKTGYTGDDFLVDLVKYFDQEVDFDLDKIREEIEQPQKLASLIARAKEKNTHPVVEFVGELFKDLAS